MAAFSYCRCDNCKVVAINSQNETWYHKPGQRCLDEYADGTILHDFFKQPGKAGKGHKPQCIWFSCGSWLFDPFCDGHRDACDKQSIRVVKIQKPKNILSISTFDEFRDFVGKYAVKIPIVKQIEAPPYTERRAYLEWATNSIKTRVDGYARSKDAIAWEDIVRDGYYGVAFNFRKLDHIVKDTDKIVRRELFNDYMWHYGFDVESLCVFDIRALDESEVTTVEF